MVFKTLVIIYLATFKLLCNQLGGDLFKQIGPLPENSEISEKAFSRNPWNVFVPIEKILKWDDRWKEPSDIFDTPVDKSMWEGYVFTFKSHVFLKDLRWTHYLNT